MFRPAYFLTEVTGYGYVPKIPGSGGFKRYLANGSSSGSEQLPEGSNPSVWVYTQKKAREYAGGNVRLKTPA